MGSDEIAIGLILWRKVLKEGTPVPIHGPVFGDAIGTVVSGLSFQIVTSTPRGDDFDDQRGCSREEILFQLLQLIGGDEKDIRLIVEPRTKPDPAGPLKTLPR